jgi:hypothetical protein
MWKWVGQIFFANQHVVLGWRTKLCNNFYREEMSDIVLLSCYCPLRQVGCELSEMAGRWTGVGCTAQSRELPWKWQWESSCSSAHSVIDCIGWSSGSQQSFWYLHVTTLLHNLSKAVWLFDFWFRVIFISQVTLIGPFFHHFPSSTWCHSDDSSPDLLGRFDTTVLGCQAWTFKLWFFLLAYQV